MVITGLVARHFYVANDKPGDSSVAWSALGTVLTAAGLLVAAVGLPLALTQLFALQRDAGRTSALVVKLKGFRVNGLALREQMKPNEPNLLFQVEVSSWIDDVARFLLEDLKDEAEVETFRQEGFSLGLHEEVDAKLKWLRNDLLPKLREGYW